MMTRATFIFCGTFPVERDTFMIWVSGIYILSIEPFTNLVEIPS